MNRRDEIRATLKLALPIAFAQVALMTMGLVDAALVGRISETDLSAVSMGNSLVFTLACPAMGVTMAVEPLASQSVGAGNLLRAWASLRAGIVACLLLAIPTLLAAAASPLVLSPLGVDPAVIPVAHRFVLARLPGMPMFLLFQAGKAYLEARGITRPLYVGGWFANGLNFMVVSVLVFGDRALAKVGLPALGLPALGSFGAGLGTSFSNTFLAAVTLFAAWKARPDGASFFAGDREELRETTRKLLRVGVPIGFQLLTEIGVFSLVSLLAGKLGARVSAAHQIALGLASYTFMGVLGLSSATAVRVGRAIGAREHGGPRRAGLVGISLSAAYMSMCAAGFFFFAGPLARIFSPDPAVLAIAEPLIRIASVFQIADGIQGVAGGALRGMGDTRFASLSNTVCFWGISLPLALLFGFSLSHGANGLWWGLSVGLGLTAIVLSTRFLRMSKRTIAAL